MDRIQGPSFSAAPLQNVPAAGQTPASGAALPSDKVTISAGELGEAKKKFLKDMLFDQTKASNINSFFDDKSLHAEIRKEEPGGSFPQGGWTLEYRNSRGSGSKFLRNNDPSGRTVSDDSEEQRPFGRLTREKDGWLGESIVESPDAQSPVSRSMMSSFFDDRGDVHMTLTEMRRDGGGFIHELDAAAYQKDPHCVPPIFSTYAFPAQERAPAPPFPFRTAQKSRELSTVDQFFGPGVPCAEVKREKPSQYAPQGGWRVHIPNAKGWSDVQMFLKDHEPPSTIRDVDNNEKQPFGTWERVAGGWQNVTEGKVTPDNFGQIRSSSLKTILGDDGSILMTLYETYEAGGGCAYQLDVGEYLRNPHKPPPILSSQAFSDANPLDETKLRASAVEREYVPKTIQDMDASQVVEKNEDWIVIGGIRLEVNKH
jgi:hypothetical protein